MRMQVHLASYPRGARWSQLCEYIAGSSSGEQPAAAERVQAVVQAALSAAPGEGGSRALDLPAWAY